MTPQHPGPAFSTIASYISEFEEFIAIPSVSADPACAPYLKEAAFWLERRLRDMGAVNVETREYRGIPMVTAELNCAAPEAPTLLLYGHYDVQPAGDREAWGSEPFTLERRGERLYGRGTTDMKGQIMALFAALDRCLEEESSAWNYRFLFEGAEESDGSILEGFIREQKELLSCDLVLNVDAGMVAENAPAIVYGCRGITGGRLVVKGHERDLHPGEFGGVVLNPVHALCAAVASLHDGAGRVALPGFYDDLLPVSEEERRLLSRLPLDDEFFRKETGASRLWGEPGFSALERSTLRPILEVTDLRVPGTPFSVSPEASALLLFRLSPEQEPAGIRKLLEAHLNSVVPDAVSWRLDNWIACPGFISDPHSSAAQSLSRALGESWGSEPLFTRSGGTLPMADALNKALGVEILLTGFQLPEDNMHGPDESIHIPTWERGVEALRRFFQSGG